MLNQHLLLMADNQTRAWGHLLASKCCKFRHQPLHSTVWRPILRKLAAIPHSQLIVNYSQTRYAEKNGPFFLRSESIFQLMRDETSWLAHLHAPLNDPLDRVWLRHLHDLLNWVGLGDVNNLFHFMRHIGRVPLKQCGMYISFKDPCAVTSWRTLTSTIVSRTRSMNRSTSYGLGTSTYCYKGRMVKL